MQTCPPGHGFSFPCCLGSYRLHFLVGGTYRLVSDQTGASLVLLSNGANAFSPDLCQVSVRFVFESTVCVFQIKPNSSDVIFGFEFGLIRTSKWTCSYWPLCGWGKQVVAACGCPGWVPVCPSIGEWSVFYKIHHSMKFPSTLCCFSLNSHIPYSYRDYAGIDLGNL